MNGIELRRMRERAGMTQEELARRIGSTIKTVSNWESGRNSIPATKAGMLASVLPAQDGEPSAMEDERLERLERKLDELDESIRRLTALMERVLPSAGGQHEQAV